MSLIERFFAKIEIGEEFNGERCWLYTGTRNSGGYGRFSVNGKQVQAHRFAYEALVGPIPEETLDHLCRVRACVNPAHLEPLSMKENALRGFGLPAINARKTTCAEGHALTWIRTSRNRKWRACKICFRAKERIRDRLSRQRDAAGTGGEP